MTRDRSPEMDSFVEEAKAVGILQAFERCGHSVSRLRRAGSEYVGPCPSCGGKDRFSLNGAKGVFNCRGAEGGGPVALAMHLTGERFLDACEILVGHDRPDTRAGDEEARRERRREAEQRLAAQRAEAEREEAERQREAESYREREHDRCREIWREARSFDRDGDSVRAYLLARGLDVSRLDGAYLRTHERLGFYHRSKSASASTLLHSGPAMIALFVVIEDGRYRSIGIHQTWLDLDAGPKFRPTIADPETGEILPTKKMRGSKAGGLIPIHGRLSQATRMVAGEGIETTLGFACFDGWRDDTFYCAAGDLGNLAGKAMPGNAEPSSRIRHPTVRKLASNGVSRPTFVPGIEPDRGSLALPVPAHIDELVLLGDGDSDPVFTRAAMKRAVARHTPRADRPDRLVRDLFAPAGMDWSDRARELEVA